MTLTALFLSLVISIQHKGRENDQEQVSEALVGAVAAAAGIPNVLRRIIGLIAFVKAVDSAGEPGSNPPG
jgi:hypothetical protein